MSLSAPQLSQHVGKALAQATGPEVFAYAWQTPWQNGDALQVGDRSIPVRFCGSPLELREALIEVSEQPQVVLVGFEEGELGQDVLARLFRHKLLHVDRWQMVADAFSALQIDPRLYSIPWIPDALLDASPRRRPQPVAVLTHDDALDACVGRLLGLSDGGIDLETLLSCFEKGAPAWNELPEERRDVYRRYLLEKLGSVAGGILGAVSAGNGHAVVGIGLACEVLFGPSLQAQADLRDARVRLEPRVGGHRLSEGDGRRWAEAAKRLVLAHDESRRQAVFRTAMDLLKAIGADAFVGVNSVLPEALDSRIEVLAEALRAFLRNESALQEVERAAEHVLAHSLIPRDHPGPATAHMVVRLCRREASLAAGDSASFGVTEYLQHGAWEDWARRGLRAVRPDLLARAVTKLLDRIAARRSDSDRRFGEQIAQRAESGAQPRGVLPVEVALSELVGPLAANQPIALIVLDGMSWDVYLPIALELARSGWTAWKRDKAPPSLLATVPSVTECSRASLLAGRLMRGNSAHEKPAFAAHEGLKRASRRSKPPVLLHKGELQDGNQLSRQATELLVDPEQRVVGIVINAIDDALAKSEQVRIDWSVEAMPLLGAILAQAKSGSRAIVITSDHGHVLERNTEHRNVGEAERWRPATGEVSQGEIRIGGPRVKALIGSDVIVPWSESIRYSTKKNGYHGGVTLQEMLVPFGIWTTEASPAQGFVPDILVPPDWWTAERDPQFVAEKPKPTVKKSQTEDLFAAPRKNTWIEELLASEMLMRQRERVGRIALDDQRLRQLLNCLDERGGRANVELLAAAIQQPQLRMRGVLSIMQRMLNVDGYPVVAMEPASNTAILDLRLLRTQFEI